MTSRLIPVSPFLLIVFGATGDLAQRKILPALYRRDRAGQLPDDAHLIGLSRREIGDEGFRSIAKKAIVEHVAKEEVDKKALDRFLARIEYLSLDVGSDHGWSALKQRVKRAEEQIRVFYLSTAPELFGPICERIGQAGMVDANTRVVVKNRSVRVCSRRVRSTTRSARCSRKTASIGSITTWARRRSRT